MLTPQEIADKKFDKVMVWGYDMNGVDSFLETVESDYDQIYKENITLKSKMKVLIAKIDEYRKVDESMRKTLLGAQTMAAEIVERAKQESETHKREALAEITRKQTEMTERIAAEEQRLEEAKTSAQAFIERIMSMYEHEQENLRALRDREFAGREFIRPAAPAAAVSAPPAPSAQPVSAPAPAEEDLTDDTLPDTVTIPSFDAALYDTQPQENTRRAGKAAAADDDDGETIVLTPKPRFEFNNLQFGEKYKQDKKR